MIAASVVLSVADCLQARHGGLELLCEVWHHCEDCTAVLTTRLEDMSKGQHLKANLSGGHADVPRNTTSTKPISLAFMVFPWQVLHSPILYN